MHDSVKLYTNYIVCLSCYQVSSLDYGEDENPVSNLYFYVEEEQGNTYRILRNEVCSCVFMASIPLYCQGTRFIYRNMVVCGFVARNAKIFPARHASS